MWSWYFPTLIDFVFPILGFEVWANSGFPPSKYNYDYVYIACIAGMSVIVYVMFFLIYSSFPENMKQNKGFGPNYAGYYLSIAWLPIAMYRLVIYRSLSIPEHEKPSLSVNILKSTAADNSDSVESKDAHEEIINAATINNSAFSDKPILLAPNSSSPLSVQQAGPTALDSFMNQAIIVSTYSRRLMGSDLTVSLLLYLLCSLIGCAYSIIMVFDNYDDLQYIGGLVCTFIYTFGVLFTWYGSYPHRLRQDNFSGSYDLAYCFIRLYNYIRDSRQVEGNPELSVDDICNGGTGGIETLRLYPTKKPSVSEASFDTSENK